jgi:hypothetical protein
MQKSNNRRPCRMLWHQTDSLANFARSDVKGRPEVLGAIQNDEIDLT